MRKLTVGKMDLSDLLRRIIYPTLEDELDKAFPEFEFRKISHGWWMACKAPSNYRDYGHAKNKLIARGWGFRSLLPDRPTVFWLAYVNKQRFPRRNELFNAVQALAKKIRISCDWDVEEEEVAESHERICRHLLPEALLTHFQGELWSPEGASARRHLVERIGIPENKLLPLEFGYYSSVARTRAALHASGFDTALDDERAGATGIYQPQWEERIVGPWRDLYGRRVFNFWGLRFPLPLEGEPVIEYLRPLDLREPLGTRSTPLGLHLAARKKQKNLLLVESPVSALRIYTRGLQNPCPVASGGSLTEEQVQVLQKYLEHGGSLTLNLDFPLTPRGDVHASTFEALDLLRNVTFPVYVVDPAAMKMEVEDLWRESIDPEFYLKCRGLEGYLDLLRKRVPAHRFNPATSTPEEDGLF